MNGIHTNVKREEYDAIHAVNWSCLSEGVRTAEHVEAMLTRQIERADTKEMKLGRATHTAVLQPSNFHAEWKVLEGVKTTTKAGCITEIENAIIKGITSSLQRQVPDDWPCVMPTPRDLFWSPGSNELVIVWEDPMTGIKCKGMIDALPDNCDYFGDLKTASNASPGSFNREIFKRNYHGQMAFYQWGLECLGENRKGAALVAVEKKRPYAWGIYPITGEALELGHALRRRLLDDYHRQKMSGSWRSYGCNEVTPPDYVTRKTQDMILSDDTEVFDVV